MLSGCTNENSKPVVTHQDISYAPQPSSLTIPVTVNFSAVKQLAENKVPQQLANINQNINACVPKQTAKICALPKTSCKKRLDLPGGGWTCIGGWYVSGCSKWIINDVSPQIDCKVRGKVNRGSFEVIGQGNRFVASSLVDFDIDANERGELGAALRVNASGKAQLMLESDIDISEDWQLVADPNFYYHWDKNPILKVGVIDFDIKKQLNEEINQRKGEFVGELKQAINQISLQDVAQKTWETAHQPFRLTDDLWLQLAPQQIGFSKPVFNQEQANFSLMFAGNDSHITFGDKPKSTTVFTPLPPLSKDTQANGVSANLGVKLTFDAIGEHIANRLAQNNVFELEDPLLGQATVTINSIKIHQTSNQALAIGISFDVDAQKNSFDTQGLIWGTSNAELNKDSRMVRIKNLDYGAATDNKAVNLLIKVLQLPVIKHKIESLLVLDYGDLVEQALSGAIGQHTETKIADNLVASYKIDDANLDDVQVSGDAIVVGIRVNGKLALAYQ